MIHYLLLISICALIIAATNCSKEKKTKKKSSKFLCLNIHTHISAYNTKY